MFPLTRSLSFSTPAVAPAPTAHSQESGAPSPASNAQQADGAVSRTRLANAGAAMRRLSMQSLNEAAEPKPMTVSIAGATHPVTADDTGSLFDGQENDLLKDGQEITIDANNPVFSRRGPNQEVMGNREEDRHAAGETHAWYPIHQADAGKSHNQKPAYVRADAFVSMKGVPDTSLNHLLPVKLRARAAPVSAYKKMSDCASPKEFIEHQKNYQNKLKQEYSKDSIMTSHRSVGFEYEFTGHSLKNAPSHISLASSAAHSELFGIKFELETDSGAVVEIGMPPFIVPNRPDGSPDKAELQAIHGQMSKAMLEVRNSAIEMAGQGAVKLPEFVDLLAQKGLGTGWKVSAAPEHAGTIENIEIRKPTAQKLAGDNIYSQMNISLNGNESAELIASVEEHFAHDPRFAEQSAMGTAYQGLKNLAAQRGLDPAGAPAVHLNKALANTLAIPSILLQAEPGLDSDHDLSSAVKELFSVWVKDSLPNILATTSATKDDLAHLKAFATEYAAPFVAGQLHAVRTTLEAMPHSRDNEPAAWGKFAQNHGGYFDSSTLRSLKQHAGLNLDAPHFKHILDAAEVLDKSMVNDAFVDAGGNEVNEGDAGFDALQETYDRNNSAFNDLIAHAPQAWNKSAFFDGVESTVVKEIAHMIQKIGSDEVIGVPATRFQHEEFGPSKGIGVRKDTQLPHDETDPVKLRTSVAEVRNGGIMEHFFTTPPA
ncbi:hypothetical protein [Massilia aquatica]|uniref:Type III effector n=1 Tax=Massilia aquatica TaxID=2609000 RepID=A0ABX0MBY6_9BURK|nr:hypothetical protein [Massilia aquatica]NHZ42475.1 hypothetical protein [Massilia aquatica]